MPRQARLDAPGTLHHVIARGIGRRKFFLWEEDYFFLWEEDYFFLWEEDYEDFLRRLESVTSHTKVSVFAWSLLPNHFHLLVRTGEVGLSSVMRRLMTGYAVSFNRRHRRHGHLFQNRYKSIVCDEEVYFLELVRYLHLNPLRARLVGGLEELAEFPYAGHSGLMGNVERPWQSLHAVFERFGTELGVGKRGYEPFVADGCPKAEGRNSLGEGYAAVRVRGLRALGAGAVRRRSRRPSTSGFWGVPSSSRRSCPMPNGSRERNFGAEPGAFRLPSSGNRSPPRPGSRRRSSAPEAADRR